MSRVNLREVRICNFLDKATGVCSKPAAEVDDPGMMLSPAAEQITDRPLCLACLWHLGSLDLIAMTQMGLIDLGDSPDRWGSRKRRLCAGYVPGEMVNT